MPEKDDPRDVCRDSKADRQTFCQRTLWNLRCFSQRLLQVAEASRTVKWELSDTFDNFLVMKPAERLLKRKMSTEHQVLLHSDQGVQYSSAGYCNLLKEYNVIQSMSRVGNPRDNAVMESFWGRFKDTLRKHFRYWECDDLRSTIEQAIYYFNNERPVRKLKGKPPVPYRTERVA